eukprot:9024319-Alexandrium_andersonii.AAC.1
MAVRGGGLPIADVGEGEAVLFSFGRGASLCSCARLLCPGLSALRIAALPLPHPPLAAPRAHHVATVSR